MYLRVTAFKIEPAKLEGAISDLRERIVPALGQAKGFLGATAIVDRAKGTGAASTLWDSLEALNNAELLGQQTRAESEERTGTEVIDVDRFEITLLDLPSSPPALPSYTRLITGYGDLSRGDEATAFLRDEVLPVLKQQPGYRSYSAGVNRMTGRAFTVSTWDSPEHREASNAAIAHLREQVMQRSAIYGAEVALVETVVAEVRVPATA